MKNRKAPELDTISAEIFSAGRGEMIKSLHILFNKVWREQDPKLKWSKINVTPAYKRDSK